MISAQGSLDGIPVALMEEMLIKLSVISTKLFGIPELVEHEVSGFLAEFGNKDELVEAIVKLIDDEELSD